MAQKIALITGASRGLGARMAIHLARQGVDIIGTYNSEQATADAVNASIETLGRKAVMLQLDVTQTDTFLAFANRVSNELERVFNCTRFDFLINNAGIGIHANVLETTEPQFDTLYNMHLKGPYFLTQTLEPLIKNGGRILNVSTGLTRITLAGYSAYAAMKGGVEIMTKYMALEFGSRGIRVNVIAPGAVETDFAGGVVRDMSGLNKMMADRTALGRVGLPDDIGGAVAAILSGGFQWANGTRIEVSGGQGL